MVLLSSSEPRTLDKIFDTPTWAQCTRAGHVATLPTLHLYELAAHNRLHLTGKVSNKLENT
eukprot:2230620-Amphidinium_carterae.7